MFTDVLIVGAGPCGLAVAARLLESTPSALFTDDEHARYWARFRRKETLQSEAAQKRKQSTNFTGSHSPMTEEGARRPSITVLDASSDSWLGAWRSRFTQLNIKHLRSPLFFHPDPHDKNGLLAYAYEHGREAELVEIPHLAGTEHSKHAQKKKKRGRQPKVEPHLRVDGRDRIDYFTPSTQLFENYCNNIVDRYRLTGVVQKAVVKSIVFDDIGCPSDGRLFAVDTANGAYLARIVVIATGASTTPCIPGDHCLRFTPLSTQAASHVFSPDGLRTLEALTAKIRAHEPVNIVVVGGGLTSAQVAAELVARGVRHVWLLLRGKYKLKHFDVDLAWVSKTRNQRMAEFWSADTDEERAEMCKQARCGGSITPAFDRELQRMAKAGKLTICPHTTIVDGAFCDNSWTITTQPTIENLPAIDHVFFATGVKPDFERIPFLEKLRDEHPMHTMAGLPVINDDLMYNDEVPMFFTGALAALRLGPGAANLAGARQGAERIAWKVQELLDQGQERKQFDGKGSSKAQDGNHGLFGARSDFTGAWTNQFDVLGLER